MPSFPITDAHLHLWDPTILRYPWLNEVPMLNRPFLLNDYAAATKGLHIEKMIFVQCECEFSQCEEEVNFVSRIADSDERIKGIVAWAPLEFGLPAKEVLDRYSENSLVKGIRRIIQFEPDPDFCLQTGFVEGVQLLAEYDYSFDICVSYHQLKNVMQLVRLCPQVRFVLDHIGKPGIKNREIAPWREQLRQLARLENVYCKMSGLVTEADHRRWTKADLAPFCDCVLEFFTPDRLMFGGDWPVVLQAASYTRWVEALDESLSALSTTELGKIYNENAQTFYRIA